MRSVKNCKNIETQDFNPPFTTHHLPLARLYYCGIYFEQTIKEYSENGQDHPSQTKGKKYHRNSQRFDNGDTYFSFRSALCGSIYGQV